MRVLVVRHASAGDREEWDGDDRLRPLDSRAAANGSARSHARRAGRRRPLLEPGPPLRRDLRARGVLGIPCLGLNGGPAFRHSEGFFFQIATENQEETDRYWNAIVGNGGAESQCGWCKDRWGLSWQITPRALTDALAAGGGEAKRAFEAMMTMKKIDVAAIEAARRG